MNEQNENLPGPSNSDLDSTEELKALEIQFKQSAEKKIKAVIEKSFNQLLSSTSQKPHKDKINKAVDQTVFMVEGVFMQSSGPLPPPVILHNYEKIVPGAGKIIVDMAKKESDHRHKMDEGVLKLESDKIKSDALTQRLGMGCALCFGSLVIGGGIFLVYIGQAGAGLMISGGILAAIMLAFIKSK